MYNSIFSRRTFVDRLHVPYGKFSWKTRLFIPWVQCSKQDENGIFLFIVFESSAQFHLLLVNRHHFMVELYLATTEAREAAAHAVIVICIKY